MTSIINQYNAQNFRLFELPQELQLKVLLQTDEKTWASLCETCKDASNMMGKLAPTLNKHVITNESAALIEQIDQRLKEVNADYGFTCMANIEECGSGQKFTLISKVFDRFKTKGQKYYPDVQIPSIRENSSELLASIRERHSATRPRAMNREQFEREFAKTWEVNKNSYDFIDVKRASGIFNGSLPAELYNLTLMKEFISKYLQNIEKK